MYTYMQVHVLCQSTNWFTLTHSLVPLQAAVHAVPLDVLSARLGACAREARPATAAAASEEDGTGRVCEDEGWMCIIYCH